MAVVAVLIADMFEDVEYTRPAKAFSDAGHTLVHLGIEAGQVVKGKKEQTPVTIDRNVQDAGVPDYDALLIPGGYSPDKLRAHEAPVRFVRHFMESEKPIFAICHAPQLLITADLLGGKRVTGWRSIAQDIKNAGAQFEDQEVVEDGNLISSRGPADLDAFIETCLRRLEDTEKQKTKEL